MGDNGFSSFFKTEQAQFSILVSLLRKKEFLREISGILRPEYFDNELHSLAAEAALEQWKTSRQVLSRSGALETIVTLLGKVLHLKDPDRQKKEVLRPVEELVSKIYSASLLEEDSLRDRALEFCRKQELMLTLQQCQDILGNGSDRSQVNGLLQKAYRRIAGEEDDIIDFFPDTADFSVRMEKISQRRIKTGFNYLDHWMGGGMSPGTETVFMAPAKGGKSSVLVNVAHSSMLRGRQVIYFTNEISKEDIDLRFTARISGISMKLMQKDPQARERGMASRASFWRTHKSRLIIKGYPLKTATVEMLRSALYSMEGEFEFRPDLVVVDYADIMRSTKFQDSGDRERFVQADVYEQLRAMASEFDCPVVTASQCGRQAVNKKIIGMEDIAESWAKCAIADHIIAICQTKEEKVKKELRLFYAGSRSGETGHAIRCSHDWVCCNVTELAIISREQILKEDGTGDD